MHSHDAVRRTIESLRTDLIERHEAWIDVALNDLEDNANIISLAKEGFKSDLEQLIQLCQEFGKLDKAYEADDKKKLDN